MRALIATVTAGAGHLQAAAALEEAWRSYRPTDVVEKLDVLDFTPKLYKKLYADGYIKVVEHAPQLYGFAFKKTDDAALVRLFTPLRRALSSLTANSFVRYLKRFRPDAVLCAHFLPLEVLGHLRKPWSLRNSPLTVSIVTDFEAHALWVEPCVDLYCVAAEETRESLVLRGAPPEKILVTGIPVKAQFSKRINIRHVRKQYALRNDLPTLLVLGGGFGMGPVEEIVDEIDRLRCSVQMLVVAGRNEELRQKLASRSRRHPTIVLGFVTKMHELMAVSDLIISKPGGLTSSEALAMGKPLLILNPIPGQEVANSNFLINRGAAVYANSVEGLRNRLGRLIGSKKLADMSRKAKALGRPQAALDICKEVARRLE